MKSRAPAKKIRKLEDRLVRQHQKLGKLKRELAPKAVEDYALKNPEGPVTLSELFGDKRDLIVVHNMGASCPYCTMWADGFNGVLPHLENRAAFVVVSPDQPKTQKAFAAKRGWKFRMVSGRGSKFAKDMGFIEGDNPLPGVSTFRKTGRKITRVASAPLGPFDPFCPVWHFFALLAGGVGNWQPKFRY